MASSILGYIYIIYLYYYVNDGFIFINGIKCMHSVGKTGVRESVSHLRFQNNNILLDKDYVSMNMVSIMY